MLLSGQIPAIVLSVLITPATGSLSLEGQVPRNDQAIVTSVGSLALTGESPVTRQDIRITPETGSLAISGETSNLVENGIITPGAGALIFSPAAPELLENSIRAPPAGSLVFSSEAPILEVPGDSAITPATGALVLTGAAPEYNRIAPEAGALALSGNPAELREENFITPAAGSLALSGVEPIVEVGGDKEITPQVGALSFIGIAPIIELIGEIRPDAGLLEIVGAAPIVAQDIRLTPSTGILGLTGNAPSVEPFAPPAGSLTLIGAAPTVLIGSPFINYRLRIQEIDYGQPGILILKCVDEDTAIFLSESQAAPGQVSIPPPTQGLGLPGSTKLQLLDTALLRDQDDSAGHYAGVTGFSRKWRGALLYKSRDGAESFDEIDAFTGSDEAEIGFATPALASWPVDRNTFDYSSTVNVRLIKGSLSSQSELNVLNGANAALIGSEIVQFKTATLNADGSYTLSELLRGRRGTEWAQSGHAEV